MTEPDLEAAAAMLDMRASYREHQSSKMTAEADRIWPQTLATHNVRVEATVLRDEALQDWAASALLRAVVTQEATGWGTPGGIYDAACVLAEAIVGTPS